MIHKIRQSLLESFWKVLPWKTQATENHSEKQKNYQVFWLYLESTDLF